MKLKLYLKILGFEIWRLTRKKNRLEKELKETNEMLSVVQKLKWAFYEVII